MKMINLFKTFAADESGAVTVDWVVLTAAIVGLGIAVMGAVSGGLQSLSGQINSSLTSTEVGFEFDEADDG